MKEKPVMSDTVDEELERLIHAVMMREAGSAIELRALFASRTRKRRPTEIDEVEIMERLSGERTLGEAFEDAKAEVARLKEQTLTPEEAQFALRHEPWIELIPPAKEAIRKRVNAKLRRISDG